MSWVLTGKLRKLLKLLLPILTDEDRFTFVTSCLGTESNLLTIQKELLSVFRLNCSQNREKIFTLALAPLLVLIWKVLLHTRHLDACVIQTRYGNLIVLRWVAPVEILHFKKLLVSTKDLFEVVRCNHGVWRQKVLAEQNSIRWNLGITYSCSDK